MKILQPTATNHVSNSSLTPTARVAAASTIVVLAVLLVTIGGCVNLPTPVYPDADAFVASELASLAPSRRYDHSIVDFTDVRESPGGLTASGLRFGSLTGNIGFKAGVAVAGDQAPPEGRFVGSPAHIRLAGAGSVRLPSPATVLGMHLVLTHEAALRHRWMPAGTAATLLVSGVDRNGRHTPTVKITPAISTDEGTVVAEQWIWADLSVLGPVTELELTFESPLADLPVLLIDNFTYSPDFAPDPDYFTIALLPDSSSYVSDAAEILGAQIRYLRELSRRGSRDSLIYVSHLGGLVADGADEEQWEAVDDAFRILDGAVPYGTAPAASDMEDPEDPEVGASLYLETFPPSRFSDHNRRFGTSEDEYSSYQIIDSPIGEILALHLAVDPSPETLEWAAGVLSAHRDTPTLVTIAAYIDETQGVVTRRSEPVLSNLDDTWTGVAGQAVWEQLIWPHEQIFLVACGAGRSEAAAIAWNRAEQPVIEMLASYDNRPAGGEGYMRLLQFFPGRSELRVLTYSPWLDTYEQDPNSYFRVPLDISGRLGLE